MTSTVNQATTLAPVIALHRPDGRQRPHPVRATRPETLDERKTGALFLRHRPSVFRFVRTSTFGDEHLADDIGTTVPTQQPVPMTPAAKVTR